MVILDSYVTLLLLFWHILLVELLTALTVFGLEKEKMIQIIGKVIAMFFYNQKDNNE